MNFVKNVAAGAVFGGALFLTAGVGLANAQPAETSDGMVGIAVGDVTILEAVPVDAAATIAGAICGSPTEDVSAVALQVDSEGVSQTVCAELPGGELVLTQNVSSPEGQPADQPEATQGSDDEAATGDGAAESEATTAPSEGA